MNPEHKRIRDEIQAKNITGMGLRHRSERLGISAEDWMNKFGYRGAKIIYDAYNDRSPGLMLRIDAELIKLENQRKAG